MRALARAAGASLSSTNYHFGTKEALLEAVLSRRAGPMNALRLARLDEAEREAAGEPLALDTILDAYVRPFFALRAAKSQHDSRPGWVATRLFFDPAPVVSRMRSELFRNCDARFVEALKRALPNREPREIEIAYRLTTGLLVHFAAGHVSNDATEQSPEDEAAMVSGLLSYAAAGLRNLATDSKDRKAETRQ